MFILQVHGSNLILTGTDSIFTEFSALMGNESITGATVEQLMLRDRPFPHPFSTSTISSSSTPTPPRLPLMLALARPPFTSALSRFRSLTLYANAYTDLTVPFCTAALCARNPIKMCAPTVGLALRLGWGPREEEKKSVSMVGGDPEGTDLTKDVLCCDDFLLIKHCVKKRIKSSFIFKI